jgi:hypothetical protein
MRLFFLASLALASAFAQSRSIPLQPSDLQPLGAKAEAATFKGKSGIKLVHDLGASRPNTDGGGGALALIKDLTFHNGSIELEVAGTVGEGANQGARGFIGLAFRLQGDTAADKYEYIYLRPTNGRAEDQVRRNHSVQYSSHPGWGWQRLRKETPEKYESYVDLEPGVWTRMKIDINGTTARLYVHGASQPTLIVSDLKQGDAPGAIALWIGPGTIGYFSNLKVTSR